VDHLPYLLADRDFYRPIEEAAETGAPYTVDALPGEWSRLDCGIWTVYVPAEGFGAAHGWQVQVSAVPARAQRVLDAAAAVCVAQEAPFKHISNALFHTWTQHKHAPRAQSGALVAAYPADAEEARRLMTALASALADEEGPQIPGTRRYLDSSVVAYRYGAFAEFPRLRPDGTTELLAPDADGMPVPEESGTGFTLPEGMADPFAAQWPAPDASRQRSGGPWAAGRPGEIGFEGLRFTRVVRRCNGGGAYLAVEAATGQEVFVKEAQDHTGLHWDESTAGQRLTREHQVLRELHRVLPGLAPRPLGWFTRWEHSFLVTESVPGETLHSWVLRQLPGLRTGTDPGQEAAYQRRCERILAQLTSQLDRLHQAGYVFVDVSPANVLVDDRDTVRLVDFEAAGRIGGPLQLLGTAGYFPTTMESGQLRELAERDPCLLDGYGLAGIAQLLLLGPLHHVTERQPQALHHLRHAVAGDATRLSPAQQRLWRTATRFAEPDRTGALPSPEQVAAEPLCSLRELRDRTADALLAMGGRDGLFPTVPTGYAVNRRCVAYGTAGVLHALRIAGRETDPAWLRRLADDSLRRRDRTPPGLHVGNAGIAWVLADHGLLEEAAELLASAERHPLLERSATLGHGAAGVALAHLALYRHDRDELRLLRAIELRESIPSGPELAVLLGDGDASGLLYGRSGVALLDHYLHRLTNDEGALRRGLALLAAEAARAVPYPDRGLCLPVSGRDPRTAVDLARGSAGFALVATRFLPHADEALASAVHDALLPASTPLSASSGLYEGRSGLVHALAEHAALTGEAASREAAGAAAARLYCHAVEHPSGVRFHGEGSARYSAELCSGSAGVVLGLTRLLDDRTDAFFTVDHLVEQIAAGAGRAW
jgi:tRNA A-37 threonylcarbamoyl transferase component Bud32